MELRFTKVREVKSPSKAHAVDAGIDFYVPQGEGRWLNPHERVNIPSGIKMHVPDGWALVAMNKSGVAVNDGLAVMACVVDAGYQGEIHLSVLNTNNDDSSWRESDGHVIIGDGQKLVQFLLIQVPPVELKEVEAPLLFPEKSNRGEGGFGSSNEKETL